VAVLPAVAATPASASASASTVPSAAATACGPPGGVLRAVAAAVGLRPAGFARVFVGALAFGNNRLVLIWNVVIDLIPLLR
jgi:hypothetical protein